MPFGAGSEVGIGGTTPSSFCRAKVSSRSASQPWSNLPFHLLDPFRGDVVRACVAPGAK